MSQAALLAKLKEWPEKDAVKLAAALLVLHQPLGFQGSVTLHYAGGKAKRLELKEAKDI